ncbi:unnamed protein product [Brassica rapa]|uniref:Knottin scorpion toxin-like domain-containing protein n=1 Tax=Brassica campestris TaxID=3711 RepID=A0A8D9DCP9_BRACM|nr:unnamed protein product [Brassica rapa]
MKIYYRSSLNCLVMLTILLLGVVANAQKGDSVPKICNEQYPVPNGKCVLAQCKTQCAKNVKWRRATCIDTGKGHMQCKCDNTC